MATLFTRCFPVVALSSLLTSSAAVGLEPGLGEGGGSLTPDQVFALGKEVYVYGYPLVTMEMTRRVMTNVAEPMQTRAPMGRFANVRRYPDASFQDVTAPNADTLYSVAWLDLSKEPYILSVPEMGNRYYLFPMLDAWTNVFASPGKRTVGGKAHDYAITGPGWHGELPAGVTEIEAPTNIVWIIGRTYSTGTEKDFAAVNALQNQYKLVPLSAWGTEYIPPRGRVDPSIDMTTAVRDQVNALEAQSFLKILADAMAKNPPAAADAPMVENLAKLGIVPGRVFDPQRFTPAELEALSRVPDAALRDILAHAPNAGLQVNGWTFSLRTGTYGTDYLQRAYVTYVGLGANLPQDAVYPLTNVDAEGRPLSGDHAHVLHFPSGELPQANGFWSLTMYNERFFFYDNPLNRYTLSPRNALQYNDDGSLDLYIQHESPGEGKESNWLPAPSGRFSLMLRLYWPMQSVLDQAWVPPGVRRVR
ncbi:DUF1254 domain-containing protein [Polyangium jinanense]|uniref:DUF1254 domain-containing protein n=1 Tax=Polyangium jinanense TaxID=2829994 RepID=A0A9X4AWH4_9BACT|nr:DUF1254 domain-containing protein [Polyangium jinanense]MDC3985340.1 DUF1254 domain-containing protein [Polyangium jinanense]